MSDDKAAAAYHPGDVPVTRPDLHTLIRDVYARISYPRDIELGRLNWDDMGGGDPSDERVEWEIAFGDVTAALAAERARADEAWNDGVASQANAQMAGARELVARAESAEARADQAERDVTNAENDGIRWMKRAQEAEQRIADAPHGHDCWLREDPDEGVHPAHRRCTCWKSAAPTAEK